MKTSKGTKALSKKPKVKPTTLRNLTPDKSVKGGLMKGTLKSCPEFCPTTVDLGTK